MNVLRPGSRRPARAVVLVMLAAVWLAAGCGPSLGDVYNPMWWRLDPAGGVPGPDATQLRILVEEVECSSQSSPVGRMSDPSVQYADDSVAITVGIRSLTGDQNCQGNDEFPLTVTLREPLGSRVLVNGGMGGLVSRTPGAH